MDSEISDVGETNGISVSSYKLESHSCPYPSCTFTSTWKSSLSLHMKTHTDERPWQCALCNKHFKLKHHLKHHILTHSQDKPFKCNLCEYRTSDSHILQRHKVSKHRFPKKRKRSAKILSMVATSTPHIFTSMSTGNTFLEQGRNFSDFLPTGSDLEAGQANENSIPLANSSTSNALPHEAFMLHTSPTSQNTTNRMKIVSVHSISESIPSPGHENSRDSDPVTDFPQESDKSSKIPSVSSPESLLSCVKEETMVNSIHNSSSRRTSNSYKETSFTFNGEKKSAESARITSPSLNHLGSGNAYSSKNDLSAFNQREESIARDFECASKKSSNVINLESKSESDCSWKCDHCKITFPDNIMYGLHMGCHSVGSPYQCNICGMKCKDKHDFMFHFTIGKHLT